MLNRRDYIQSVAEVVADFKQLSSFSAKSATVLTLLDVINDPESDLLDKSVAVLKVYVSLMESLNDLGLTNDTRYISVPADTLNFLNEVGDIFVIYDSEVEDLVARDVFELTSAASGLISSVLSAVPVKNLYSLAIETFFEMISSASGLIALSLPTFDDIKASLEQEFEDKYHLFNYQIDQYAQESVTDFIRKATAEAALVDMTYEELVAELRDEWGVGGHQETFEEHVEVYVNRKKEDSQAYYDNYVNKVDNVTVEDYVAFQEPLIGEFNWVTGEYSDSIIVADLDRDVGFYLDDIHEYVGVKLVELYGEQLVEIIEEVEADLMVEINAELALIEKSDDGSYETDLAEDLERERNSYQQEGEAARSTADDNSDLKNTLEEKQGAFPEDAKAAAEPTLEKVRNDVELELEKRAKEDIEDFIADLLENAGDEVSEEHSEVHCPTSHERVDAWDRSARERLEDYPVDLIVDTTSDASGDNVDRKSRLEVLVENTKAALRNFLEGILDDLESISDEEDPAECGGPASREPDFGGAEHITSPLVIDLDGDGIETLSNAEFIYGHLE